jgi:hypothetical protein
MKRLSSCNLSIGAALALGLLASGAASAQSTTGNLEGSAAVGDSVTVRNVATEHSLENAATRSGRFHFRRLPIGIYEVVIHHADGSVDPPIHARARLGETVQVN